MATCNKTSGAVGLAAIFVRFQGLSPLHQCSSDAFYDKLQLYFQSHRRSGGGDIKSVCIRTHDDDPFAIIMFEKQEDAQSVLARRNHELIINNQRIGLVVEPANEVPPDSLPSDPPQSGICSPQSPMSSSPIRTLQGDPLQSGIRSPQSPMSSSPVRTLQGNLARSGIRSPQSQMSSTPADNSDSDDDCYDQGDITSDQHANFRRDGVRSREPLRNIPDVDTTSGHSADESGDAPRQFLEVSFGELSLDTVVMYFESRRRSGGGAIASHKLVQPGMVNITFEEAGLVEQVCTKSHTWEGKPLDVSMIEERGPVPNTIEVSGFASSIGNETLEMYFESRKRSGGGDVKESSMNDDRSIFTITFVEAVVEEVLRRKHQVEKSKLTVKRPGKVLYRRKGKKISRISDDLENPRPPCHEDDVHLLVCFEKVSLETVLMYFESKRSKGGEIVKHELLQPGNLVITFQEPGVAERVCSRSHRFEGEALEVSLIQETGPAPNTIEVTRFASMGEDTLELYFESKKRSGGGEIMESIMNDDKNKFTITFADERVLDSILDRDHKLEGTKLEVCLPKKEWQHKHHMDRSVIEVHGVNRNITQDYIQMYFESDRAGGDGSDVNAVYNKDVNVWTVKFENHEIAERVLKKPHKLKKKKITVSRPQPKRMSVDRSRSMAKDDVEKQDDETVPLELEDVKSSISEDHLRLYFENQEKSCGGPIAVMQKNPRVAGSWTIYFQKSGVAERVAKQTTHELAGSRLKFRLGMKRLRRPIIDHSLLITDLPKQLSEEMFHLYLEKVTSKKDPKIKFGRDPTKAMVIYKDTIKDVDDVISRIKEEKFSGASINAKKVFEVDTVIVKNLNKKTTEEILKLYFENNGRSGGGDINDMQLDKNKLEVIIQFGNYKVVDSVVKKKHHVEKKDLDVCLYYDDIGEFVSDGCQWKPDAISIKEDPYLLTFALMAPNLIDKFLAAGINIEHNDDYPEIVKLHFADGCALDLNNIPDWEEYVGRNYKQLIRDQFDMKKLDIGDECFEEFQEYLKVETEGVRLVPDDSSPSLMIVGVKDGVEKVFCHLSQQLKIMNDEIKRKKNIIKRAEKCKPIKIKKIKLLEFEEIAMSKFGVELVVDDSSSTITFEGLPDDIDNASLYLYKNLENIEEVSFPCDAPICEFLIKFYHEVLRVEKDNMHHIDYEIEGQRVKIYSMSMDHAKAAKSNIEGRIKLHKYPLPNDKMQVMKSADGQQLLVDLKSQSSVTVEVVDQPDAGACIMITGFDMVVSQVVKRINDFLQTNQILKKQKRLERGMIRLFQNNAKEIAVIENDLNMFFVKIIPLVNKSCIEIRGNQSGIEKAVERIIAFESRVLFGKHLVSQPGMTSFFKEDRGRRALDSVENACNCIVEFNGGQPSTAPMQVFIRHKLPKGVELIVCKADMTEMQVDVIVNAANDRLQHAGGLAKAIVDAGGKEIQHESDKIMAGRTLRPGEVVVTGAGKLPCKTIIHTVGPRYTAQQPKAMERLLKNAVASVYEEADRRGLVSIGMPAISSGVYMYPLKPCTKAILQATEEYFAENPRSHIQQVYFLSVDMKVCKEFESSMEVLFNVDRNEDGFVVLDDDNGYADFGDGVDVTEDAALQMDSNSGLKINGDIVSTRESFTVTLIKGKIEDSKVDVIVNTTSGDLNLNTGNVSRALLAAAGPQLQQECDAFKATGGKIPIKGFLKTGPALLKCREVFHTSSKQYSGPESIQNIRELLRNLFLAASTMRSIAIPALGTGNLRYPADVVAKVMYEEAIAFSAKYPQSLLKDIKFLVFHKDLTTIQAFVNEISNLAGTTGGRKLKKGLKAPKQHAVSHSNEGARRKTVPPVNKTSSPYRGFQSLSQMSAKMDVAGVTVTIKQGDITDDDADAIVNLTSRQFDLSAGAVSKAILKAGGKAIQKECLKNKSSATDEVWTGSGKLKCTGICHIPVTDDISSLKPILIRIMKTANRNNYGTLAFPAIGTGSYRKLPKASLLFILECICSFAMKENPANLRDIRIIVFEIPMTLQFIFAMKEMEGKPLSQKGFLQKGYDFVKSMVAAGVGEFEGEPEDSPPSTLTLKILALDEDIISKAKGRIQSIISEETTQRTIHRSVFHRLTQVHIMKLNEIGAKHEVVIDMTNIQADQVDLHGRIANVADAQQDVVDLVGKIQDEERKQSENKQILKDVKWYYQSAHDMEEFGDDIVCLFERAYQKKEKKLTYTADNDHKYVVDLVSMTETDFVTMQTNAVLRRDLTVGQDLPLTWSQMKPTEKLLVVDLQQGTEYQGVEQQFTAALGGQFTPQSIVKIRRIQNIELWKCYAAKKEAFEKSMPGQKVERVLYHGTDEGTIDQINIGGFNRSYAGKNATVYGLGTYFATSAGYSARDTYSRPNANQEKHMYLCHVLVGQCAKGAQGMLAPPQGSNCAVDNPANPQIVVIFNDVQAYPSYLIVFK